MFQGQKKKKQQLSFDREMKKLEGKKSFRPDIIAINTIFEC